MSYKDIDFLLFQGGYCIDTLAEGVALSLKTLLGDPCQLLEPLGEPHPRYTINVVI